MSYIMLLTVMDEIREYIQTTLPSLSTDAVESVVEKLQELGADTFADLKYVAPADLEPILKPIQARKLLHSFQSMLSIILSSNSSRPFAVVQCHFIHV